MYTTSAIVLAAVTLASAKTIDVTVGAGDALVFNPSIVTAAVGDKVDFHFFPKNHSVVASSFAAPCVPVQPDGGIFSGFQPTTAEQATVFEVTVNDTMPIWIYCAQATHCESGMSMVINQPTNNKTLAAYQAAAKSVPASAFPPDVNGGIFLNPSGTTGNSTTGTSSGISSSGTSTSGSGSGSSGSGSSGSGSSSSGSSGSGSSSSGSGSSSSGSGSTGSGSSGSGTSSGGSSTTSSAAGSSSSSASFTGAATAMRADYGIVAAILAAALATSAYLL